MRIAIIKLGALGDVVRTTVLLRPLHRRYPGCQIWWYTCAIARPLLEPNPWISRLISIETCSTPDAEAEAFDLVICLDDEKGAGVLCASLPAKDRFGAYWDGAKMRYTPSSRAWFDMGLLNRDADGSLSTANCLKAQNPKTYPQILFDMLHLTSFSSDESEPTLPLDMAEESWAQDFAHRHHLGSSEFKIGLNTGAGSRWINKQLSIPMTLRLIDTLGRKPGRPLLLLGGPEETERNQQIFQRTTIPLINTGTNNSLSRFISIINLCDAIVTSDSLALHIAAALKKKVIAFFGPTSAPEIEFYGRGIAWMPRQKCQCFYRPHCLQNDFCLDTVEMLQAADQLEQWQLNPGSKIVSMR